MTRTFVNRSTHATRPRSFDCRRYLDATLLGQEWHDIWRRNWLLAGLASDLARPGDWFVFELGPEQVLLTRDAGNVMRAFYNVCQHRGNRLVSADRGHSANLRCAYHAWTYELDGALTGVPGRERFPDGVDCAQRSLRPVAVDTWNGFVFVHLGEPECSLAEFLGPVAQLLAPYAFAGMTLVEDQSVQLDCNWKAVVDNFSELYHVDFLHPQHKRMVDCSNDTVQLFDNGHTGLAVPGATTNPRFALPDEPTDIQSAQLTSLGLDPADFRGRVPEVRRAVQLRKREVGTSRGFDYRAFDDDQLSDVWQYNLFPNAILSFTPEHCWVLRPRPHPVDPGRCSFDKLSLVRFADPRLGQHTAEILGPGRQAITRSGLVPDGYHRPERDVFDYSDVVAGRKSMTDTIDQDVELLGNVQAGMASAGFETVLLSEDEMRIAHFHDEWERQMRRRTP